MAKMITVEIEGLQQMFRKLDQEIVRVERAVLGAIFEEAEEVITAAKLLTPVDEGFLRNSGHVQLPKRVADGFEIVLGFGGPAGSGTIGGTTNREPVGYAVIVHEDLFARHNVGQAKYLEIPLRERSSKMGSRIARRAGKRLGGRR